MNEGQPAAKPQSSVARLVYCGLADLLLCTGWASHDLYVTVSALQMVLIVIVGVI